MRGILIDPETRTIQDVEYHGDYREIYQHIKCDTFAVVTIERENAIFVDDEGLLKNPRYFFKWKGYPEMLAGRGLILGTDAEGESIATDVTVTEASDSVTFHEGSIQGFLTTAHKGDNGAFIRTEPVFGPPEDA